ncbi:magnesium transporter [Anaerosoma tenue]|uniref:magnesium transporter n=1 Tax=Anaerosoma tenue TaxID=2933588 RepID=UPI002260AD8A|nr:CBS domain-containing protein [Anaerosoma tenue]MCK8115238.1 CBS domain-containing protein [Anaerosoma tenue]
MFYLTQMLGKPVVDAAGEVIGEISDIAIATGEVFPRVTSLAFLGPDKTPFMLSWRKFVASLEDERVQLNAERAALRFSYLQPDEVLLARDLLNKQIVDTQGMKVVRVNDLKLSESRNQLRLLGAEVGARGILRGLHPAVERAAASAMRLLGRELSENLIAWNYMDLLDRDLSHVRLSITHKRLHELHPADVADVLEQLHPSQRARVFEHLDNVQAALTVAELEDEFQADLIGDLGDQRASDILEEMDPDDAADIIGDLPYDKAEALLRLMGVSEAQAIRSLLGYREKTAGGIMTPEVTTLTDDMTVQGVVDHLRTGAAEHESIYYIYVVDDDRRLEGVVSLRDLVMSEPDTPVTELIQREVITVNPDDDQELVAEMMSKYDLLALPVIDETGVLLGIVTVDDALDVLEEESAEDLAIATGAAAEHGRIAGWWWWLVRRNAWLLVWAVAFLAYISLRVPLAGLVEGTGSSARAGTLLMGWAVVILPLLLRTAEDLSSRTLAELIEGDAGEERPSLGSRLLREGGIGLVTAALSALVAFGLAFLLLGDIDPAATPFAVSTAVAALLTALAGGLLGHLALRRSAAGKTVSGTGLSVMTMLLSAVVYLTLAYVAGSLGSVPGTGA